jgi:hypothetical protein
VEDRIQIFTLRDIREQDRDLMSRARETIQHCLMVVKETPPPDTLLGRLNCEPFPMDSQQ